jgi:hypothetical protein
MSNDRGPGTFSSVVDDSSLIVVDEKGAGLVRSPEQFTRRPAGHHYSLGVMTLFVEAVLGAAVSLRGAAAVLRFMSPWLPGPDERPTAAAGECWLLRLGLYALTRRKQKADDWAWIVDHTIQLGPWKVLLVVGVRLSAWQRERGPLTHQDLEFLLIDPVTRSTGEVVEGQLRQVAEKTGVPRMILSDQGTDLKRGIDAFRRKQTRTVLPLYDIKHQAASVLKRQLETDQRWAAFLRNTNQTKAQIRQTALAYLMPPAPREKARFMNVDVFVRWGQKTLAYLEGRRGADQRPVDRDVLNEKLGWLRDFREELSQWDAMLQVVNVVLDEIRSNGYHRRAASHLRARLKNALSEETPAGRVAGELAAFVKEQSAGAEGDECLLGSSEVLESLIGKGKRLHGQHSKGGFTKMLLAMAAAVVPPEAAVLHEALGHVKTRDVTRWTLQHLGRSLTSQRRLAYAAGGTKTG